MHTKKQPERKTNITTNKAAKARVILFKRINNSKIVNIPSYLLKVGDVVGVRERSKSLEMVEESLSSRVNYSWLEWNGEKMEGKFLNYPERAEIPENIAEQLIVELYSK